MYYKSLTCAVDHITGISCPIIQTPANEQDVFVKHECPRWQQSTKPLFSLIIHSKLCTMRKTCILKKLMLNVRT